MVVELQWHDTSVLPACLKKSVKKFFHASCTNNQLLRSLSCQPPLDRIFVLPPLMNTPTLQVATISEWRQLVFPLSNWWTSQHMFANPCRSFTPALVSDIIMQVGHYNCCDVVMFTWGQKAPDYHATEYADACALTRRTENLCWQCTGYPCQYVGFGFAEWSLHAG